MSNTRNTERLIDDMLPTMMDVNKENATPTYHSFITELNHITAENTPLDWEIIHDATDTYHGDEGQTRELVGMLAARTIVGFDGSPRRMGVSHAVRVHGDEGTFVVVSPEGKIMASYHRNNPDVPEEYGIPDPWPFYKIAEAAVVHSLGFNPTISPGYGVLKQIKSNESPHIGHSLRIEDDELFGICGTTGRTLTHGFRTALSRQRPDIAARMTGRERHPDDLAGFADSLSGSIALRSLSMVAKGVTPTEGIVCGVNLPVNPEASEHQGVNWN